MVWLYVYLSANREYAARVRTDFVMCSGVHLTVFMVLAQPSSQNKRMKPSGWGRIVQFQKVHTLSPTVIAYTSSVHEAKKDISVV